MSALVRLLYPPAVRSRQPVAVIGWWERRRLRYNLVVGGTGLVTLAVISALGLVPPFPRTFLFPPAAVLVYAIMANLFYTAGWVSELVFNAWWREDPPAVGPVLFRQGLIFSVGLTLLPVGLAILEWGFRVVRWLF
ncbi:MAG: hypothetical protein AB7L66_03995 [Gemmatimonadales bacterium]